MLSQLRESLGYRCVSFDDVTTLASNVESTAAEELSRKWETTGRSKALPGETPLSFTGRDNLWSSNNLELSPAPAEGNHDAGRTDRIGSSSTAA